MNAAIVETVNVTRAVAWLPWAVQYFFLIGLSYGAFLLSLPGVVCRRPGWQGIGRLALLGALLCGLTAPVALLSDLHQPARFLNFYLYPQLTSWMSWGAFFIPIYLTGLILYAWLAFRPLLANQAGRPGWEGRLAGMLAMGGLESRRALLGAAALAFIGAALVALYTGAEVMVVRARPLWHTSLLPVQFLFTALGGAAGLTLLFNRFAGAPADLAQVRRLARCLAATQAAVLLVGGMWLLLAGSGLSGDASLALRQLAPSFAWRVTAVWAAGSAAFTFFLAWRHPGRGLLIGLLALHSAWMMRWTIFIGGQEIPKSGAGFYHYTLPLGHDGLLGIIGTGGLWIALLIGLTMVLPVSRINRGNA